MMRPVAERLQLGGGTRVVLGSGIISCFFKPEAIE